MVLQKPTTRVTYWSNISRGAFQDAVIGLQ
jgi:hypothetical protein